MEEDKGGSLAAGGRQGGSLAAEGRQGGTLAAEGRQGGPLAAGGWVPGRKRAEHPAEHGTYFLKGKCHQSLQDKQKKKKLQKTLVILNSHCFFTHTLKKKNTH